LNAWIKIWGFTPKTLQKAFIDWIYEAKTTATQTKRIVSMLERLDKNLGFYS
jgi:hypothetical protein